MRTYAFLAMVGLMALGCNKIDTGNAPVVDQTKPDNTAVNRRDTDPAMKTPIDQNENKADVNRTAEIRKRIVETPDLSVNARNVKVITANGKVTLRGPVNSEPEKELVGKIALDVAGAGNVDNQLEVAAANP